MSTTIRQFQSPRLQGEGAADRFSNCTISRNDIDGSILDLLHRQIDANPDNLAAKAGRAWLTYQDLDAAANRVANALLSRDESRCERIGLLFEPSFEAVIAYVGALKAGKTCVALDPYFPAARLETIAADAGITALVTSDPWQQLAHSLTCPERLQFEALSEEGAESRPSIECHPDDGASMIYTSGSTGSGAKGVVNSHRNLLHRVWSDSVFHQIGPADRHSLTLSLAFGSGLPNLLTALLNGAAIFPLDLKFREMEQVASWLAGERITILSPPVSVLRQFLRLCPADARFPDCRVVVQGGQATIRADLERFWRIFDPACRLVSEYGSTEAQIVARVALDSASSIGSEVAPIGFAEPDKEILLRDAEGLDVEVDEVGELWVRSCFIAEGYWQQAQLNAEVFRTEADKTLFRTRDLAVRRSNGLLEYRGRADLVVKLRGYRIDVAEIEAVLLKNDGIRNAAVACKEMDDGKQQLVAYVVVDADNMITADNLRSEVAERLPDYMVPSRVVYMDELPHTGSGKLDRLALPDPGNERPLLSDEIDPPTSDLEHRLVEIWQEILNTRPIGIRDDFFDLGGDSLAAVQLTHEIEVATGKKVPASYLVDHPTIASLIEHLQSGDDPISMVSLTPITAKNLRHRPVFGILGVYLYKELAEQLQASHRVYGVYVDTEIAALRPAGKGLKSLFGGLTTASFPSVEALATAYIEQIRTIQPTGPYQLIGSSFGGLVAFEMAKQLRDLGESVSLLGFLDTFAPGAHRPNSLKGWLHRFRLRLECTLAKIMPVNPANTKAWQKYSILLRSDAEEAYSPQPLDIDAVLLKAEDAVDYPGYETDATFGWTNWIRGQLDVKTIPGDHLGMLKEPNVSTLADIMRPLLDHGCCDDETQPPADETPARRQDASR